jgi:hypothetical protein
LENKQRQDKNTGRMWEKLNFLLALSAILLTVILFFGLHQNLAGLGEMVSRQDDDILRLHRDVAAMQLRLGELETFSAKAKEEIVLSTVEAMLLDAEFLRSQAATDDVKQRLDHIREILLELKARIPQQ